MAVVMPILQAGRKRQTLLYMEKPMSMISWEKWTAVALHLTVVTNTSAQSGVEALERDARVAWVVSSLAVAHETTAVPGSSNHDR
jgi:hypothetical protein